MRLWPHPFSMEETVAWIETMQERYERDGFALWAVEDASTGAFLGNVGPCVQHVDGVDEVELGWSITPIPGAAGDRHRGRRGLPRLGLRDARRRPRDLADHAGERSPRAASPSTSA